MRNDILVAEISGKRPGNAMKRPTERFEISFDKVIISNNSDGYITDWPIVNVPEEYVEYYKSVAKMSDNAWYAPMNRSYAIKYARDHGYKYLIQLDDNIVKIELSYVRDIGDGNIKRFRGSGKEIADDAIETLILVLENTNAGMAGLHLNSFMDTSGELLAERYVYSFFALNLDIVPELFQGDFEDDIEYRLKLKQMGIPSVQVIPIKYGKTGQKSSHDETGNRKAYTEAGVNRGAHMRKLYGDIYSCGLSGRAPTQVTLKHKDIYFRHKIKPFKVGLLIKDQEAINDWMKHLFKKYGHEWKDECKVREKRVKKHGTAEERNRPETI